MDLSSSLLLLALTYGHRSDGIHPIGGSTLIEARVQGLDRFELEHGPLDFVTQLGLDFHPVFVLDQRCIVGEPLEGGGGNTSGHLATELQVITGLFGNVA